MNRAMATETGVAGAKEGKGKGGKGNCKSKKCVKRGTAMATKRAIATATRVEGNKESNGKEEGNGNSDRGGGQ